MADFANRVSKYGYGTEARTALVSALQEIAKIVSSTMGPGGRPVGFNKLGPDMRPTYAFTKDGITVLKSLAFGDEVLQAVLHACKQSASHSVLASGDGPQPLYSKILTPKGFIEMRDARVGMDICGVDGSIQKIVGIFPKGEKEIYRVEFSNNRVVECCADHLWTVTNTGTMYNKVETKTTKDLSEDYFKITALGDLRSKYYTPRVIANFQNNTDEMPLDPYLVGLLLGDGSLSGSGSVELSLGIKKEHVIGKIVLPEGLYLSKAFVNYRNSFRVKINGKTKTGKTPFDILRSIGLFGVKSSTKFIPKSYLYSSLECRQKLLQGLLDTDGYINKKGLFEFSTISQELSKDFLDLCRSLGKTVTVTLHERSENDNSYSKTPIYRIVQLKGYKHGDKICKIEPTGKFTEMQCIKVSNCDNLYVTDNFIATHNTSSTIILASEVARTILECGAKYPQAFAREIMADADRAIQAIRREAVKDPSVIRKVALTSSNGDEELTDIVLEAIKGSSALGTLLVEKNPATSIRYRISKQDGYSNCHGYNYNSIFAISASENAASSKAIEWDNPIVICFNGALYYANEQTDQIQPIINAWNKVNQTGTPRSLVIVAHDVSDEVSNKLLVLNRKLAKYGIGSFVVKPRLTAEINASMQILRDIASYVGVSDEKILDGGNYKSVDETFFGTCGKVKIMQSTSAFLGRSPSHWVDKRILQNQSIVEEARSEFDKQMTSIRNAELAEGLVKVEIGGGMLSDIQERADRFDDASKATQSCMEHGALPGSGCSYIRAALLAGAHHSLANALRSVYDMVLTNYGVDPNPDFMPLKGMCVSIGDSGTVVQNAFEDGGVLDSCETVCSVIKNGVELGVMIATAGGYSYRFNVENE